MDVKSLCLGTLMAGPMSGYEIKRAFDEAFAHFLAVGYGSIYPALAQLTQTGLVTCETVAQDGRPDKKVYALTETGRSAFARTLRRTKPRHKVRSEFVALLYFADYLPPAHVETLIDEMAAIWQAEWADMERCVGNFAASDGLSPGRAFAAGLGRAIFAAKLDYLKTHKVALIEHLRAEAQAEASTGQLEAAE